MFLYIKVPPDIKKKPTWINYLLISEQINCILIF